MLTIYHLNASRSTRVIWLAEELELTYTLEIFEREANYGAPASYKALHPLARAPLIRDGDVTLGESGAIIDYLITRYGGGKLMPKPDSADYPNYIYWLHFAEGSAMQHLLMLRMLEMNKQDEQPDSTRDGIRHRATEDLTHANNVLGSQPYFAGDALTGADINMFFALRYGRDMIDPLRKGFPHIAAYLERIEARPAYEKAMLAG